MNSAWGGLRPTVGLRRPEDCRVGEAPTLVQLLVGEGRRLACSALEGRFEFGRGPSADGRPAPTGELSFASAKADAWRAAPGGADFNRHEGRWLRPAGRPRPACRMNSAWGAFGRRSACADREGVFCVGEGRRLACSAWRGRFQSARRPSVNGRPAPTEERRLRRRRPTLGVQRLGRPISIGTEAFGRRSACADRGTSLLRRPSPTLGAQRLEGPISIGTEAFGQRSACADREGVFCVGEGRRLACSALEGRFQSARRPSADGRPAPTAEELSFASAKADAWRAAPGRPISIGTEAFGRRSACADRRIVFCVGEGRRPAHSALEGRFQSARRPSADGRSTPTEERRLRRRRPTPGA
jgi:hypothetical protein